MSHTYIDVYFHSYILFWYLLILILPQKHYIHIFVQQFIWYYSKTSIYPLQYTEVFYKLINYEDNYRQDNGFISAANESYLFFSFSWNVFFNLLIVWPLQMQLFLYLTE